MSFFKAYDMRGTFGTDFDLDTVFRVGKALPKVVGGTRWLVGRDCRTTSEAVRDALVAGLSAAGVEVTDLGLCTTPMVYYFTAEDGYDGSVMITASHNPPSDNGLKVSKRGALPVGYVNGLDEVEKLVAADDGSVVHSEKGTAPSAAPSADVLARYSGFLKDSSAFDCGRDKRVPPVSAAPSPPTPSYCGCDGCGRDKRVPPVSAAPSPPTPSYCGRDKRVPPLTHNLTTYQPTNLTYAIDCSNGMASLLVKDLFPGAIVINDTLDGTFPNHSPNPLKPEAREQLAALVRERGLDCGVIFDGDADRCMFVDEKGDFIQPDYLIPVVARATLADLGQMAFPCGRDKRVPPVSAAPSPPTPSYCGRDGCGRDKRVPPGDSPCGRDKRVPPSPHVIHDVRTSRGATDELRRMGCEPVMVPVGHAFAKPALRETGAVCGGELAGHYYFSDFHCCDSGALAALRILGEVAQAKARGQTFSEMMAPIAGVYDNSGEINFKVADKDAAIARALAVAAEKLPREVSRTTMDGVRIDYDEGWINIRKSNTEPYLRLVAERRGNVREWVTLLTEAIEHDA